MREEASTTYTGAMATSEAFGRRLYTEVWDGGWERAEKKVVRGALGPCGQAIHQREERKRWAVRLQNQLNKGRIEAVNQQIRSFPAPTPEAAEALRMEADYFHRNAERRQYPEFRKQNLLVGSGVMEAACPTVIAQRLKLSGMFWSVRGANAIIVLC